MRIQTVLQSESSWARLSTPNPSKSFLNPFPLQQILQLREMATNDYCTVNLMQLSLLLTEIQQLAPSRVSVRNAIKELNLGSKEATVEEMKDFAENIESRMRMSHLRGAREAGKGGWVFGEQKLFCSVIPYYFLLHNLNIRELKCTHLQPLEKIFLLKSAVVLYFELKYLDSLNNNFREGWSEQHLSNFTELMTAAHCQQEESSISWKQLSLDLFVKNECAAFHSPRDVREMWMNHLNPRVSKEEWTTREDLDILLRIRESGCRWAFLSKQMNGIRTEHMIKNRVNSIMRRMRFRSKILKSKHIDEIIADLSSKIALEKQKDSEEMSQQSADRENEQSHAEFHDLSSVDSAVQNKQQTSLKIFDVLSFEDERILVTRAEIDENWQYDQEVALQDYSMGPGKRTLHSYNIFDELLLPSLQPLLPSS